MLSMQPKTVLQQKTALSPWTRHSVLQVKL
uniref:Uncharacterized protein n=1 Tax=Arundo donax TaxID=35708 RepID=A0A0A9DZ80_ARUDO